MTPKELVLGGYKSFAEGDMESLGKMYHEDGVSPGDIADHFDRYQSCICRILFEEKKKAKKIGRPQKLSPEQVDRLIKKKEQLVEKANAKYDITKARIVRSARCKASEKTVARRFKEREVKFSPHKEKIPPAGASLEKKLLCRGRPSSRWTSLRPGRVLPPGGRADGTPDVV